MNRIIRIKSNSNHIIIIHDVETIMMMECTAFDLPDVGVVVVTVTVVVKHVLADY